MRKRIVAGMLMLLMFALLVSGCGQSKIVGTWAGEPTGSYNAIPILTIKETGDKSYSIDYYVLRGTESNNNVEIKEMMKKTFTGTSNDGTTIHVSLPSGMSVNFAYNKDSDTIQAPSLHGDSKNIVYKRFDKDKDMDSLKEKAKEEYLKVK